MGSGGSVGRTVRTRTRPYPWPESRRIEMGIIFSANGDSISPSREVEMRAVFNHPSIFKPIPSMIQTMFHLQQMMGQEVTEEGIEFPWSPVAARGGLDSDGHESFGKIVVVFYVVSARSYRVEMDGGERIWKCVRRWIWWCGCRGGSRRGAIVCRGMDGGMGE